MHIGAGLNRLWDYPVWAHRGASNEAIEAIAYWAALQLAFAAHRFAPRRQGTVNQFGAACRNVL